MNKTNRPVRKYSKKTRQKIKIASLRATSKKVSYWKNPDRMYLDHPLDESLVYDTVDK